MGSLFSRWMVVLVLAASLLACRKRKPMRVTPVAGESPVLPKVTYAPTDSGAVRGDTHSITVDGRTRTYLLVEPPQPPKEKLPVVFMLHGDGADGPDFRDELPLDKASGSGAYLFYPTASNGWDLETTENNRDVAFMRALVDELEKRAPIDRSRIYAAGYSNGGFMANVLACQAPGFVRAIASYAGGAPYNQREKWSNGYTKCPGQKPVSALVIHGTKDRGVKIDSGRFSAAYWAYVAGCSAEEMETTGYPECNAYRGCPAGMPVVFCEVPSGQHYPLKAVWDRLAETTWTFFERVR